MGTQLFRPKFEIKECLNNIEEVLESGWTGTGPKCAEFEKVWCEFTGAKNSLFLHSATAALHLALKCLDLPIGSKVITTPMTFISTNAVILYENLTPVFADINIDDGSLDSESVIELIEKHNPKAIMWVHLGGNVSSHFYRVLQYIKTYNLDIKVIEDCAHAGGSFYGAETSADGYNHFSNIKRVGSLDNTISCFSGDTLVTLADGSYKRLDLFTDKDIGSEVIGFLNGQVTKSKIISLVKQKKDKHYKVTLSDRTNFICDEDHLFIIKRNNKWMDIPAKYIVPGDYVGKPINFLKIQQTKHNTLKEVLLLCGAYKDIEGKSNRPKKVPLSIQDNLTRVTLPQCRTSNLEGINLIELCYVFGLVFSDGHVSGNMLRFTNTKLELLSYIQDFYYRSTGKKSGLYKAGAKTQNCFSTIVGGMLMCKLYKYFLDCWIQFSEPCIAAFLSGFFDGDGSVCIDKDGSLTISLATCEHEDTQFISLLARSIGLDPFIQYKSAWCRTFPSGLQSKCKPSSIIRLFASSAVNLLSYGFIKHADKIRKWSKWERKKSIKEVNRIEGDLCLRRIKTIEEVLFDDYVYCINTETENFIANETLVHNCFSQQAVKNLPCADGGVLCCSDEKLMERARRLSWLGIDKSTYARTNQGSEDLYKWRYTCNELGFKYNGNDIMAAILLTQIKYLDRDNAYRRQIYKWYKFNFDYKLNMLSQSEYSSNHLCVVKVGNRERVIAALKLNGYAPGVHYLPNFEFPVFHSFYNIGDCPNTEKLAKEILSLPCHLLLTKKDVDAISEIVLQNA